MAFTLLHLLGVRSQAIPQFLTKPNREFSENSFVNVLLIEENCS